MKFHMINLNKEMMNISNSALMNQCVLSHLDPWACLVT